MGKKKLFNEQQEQYILEHYKTMSNRDIAEVLNCKPTQINSWLIHRGIKRGKEHTFHKSIFSDNDVDFITKNYAIMTATEIGKVLGFSKNQIDGKIAKLNLDKKKRKANHKYFSSINTPLKAYYLGFIFADGWVICNYDNNNYEVGMELQSCDKYILEKLNEELGGEFIISHKDPKVIRMKKLNQLIHSNDSDVIRIYSKQIVEDLINIGIVPNKTQKDVFPNIDSQYFYDFLRGYIDGDGCYYVNNGRTYMHITSANPSILKYIQNVLFQDNIHTKIYQESERKYRLMCVNTIDMNYLVNHLYYEDDLFCLKRKFEKIKHFIGYAA